MSAHNPDYLGLPAPTDGAVDMRSRPIVRRDEMIFIPLPRELWRPIDGGCCCPYCSHDRKPGPAYWDTLAIPRGRPKRGTDRTWNIHAPEMNGAELKR